MGAIFILLTAGAMIGTWNMAGTIPTIVSCGLVVPRPAILFAAVAVSAPSSASSQEAPGPQR